MVLVCKVERWPLQELANLFLPSEIAVLIAVLPSFPHTHTHTLSLSLSLSLSLFLSLSLPRARPGHRFSKGDMCLAKNAPFRKQTTRKANRPIGTAFLFILKTPLLSIYMWESIQGEPLSQLTTTIRQTNSHRGSVEDSVVGKNSRTEQKDYDIGGIN